MAVFPKLLGTLAFSYEGRFRICEKQVRDRFSYNGVITKFSFQLEPKSKSVAVPDTNVAMKLRSYLVALPNVCALRSDPDSDVRRPADRSGENNERIHFLNDGDFNQLERNPKSVAAIVTCSSIMWMKENSY